MPDLQITQQSVIRYGNYALVGGYLSVVPRKVLFSRAVNQATIGDQLMEITFDDPYSGVGTYTDVIEDAEIVFYDQNSATVKGRARVAWGGATSTVLQIDELSKGRLEIANNDKFEVLDEFRLHHKLVGATDTFPKDSRREYVDEGEEPAPAIICGGAAVGWIDPITGVLEVEFDASGSYPTDTDNTGGLTYLWDVADGTITVGADTDDRITVEFDTTTTHFRHVTLTVTDADTGKATVRKIPVWSHDADNLPVTVTKADYGFDRSRGDWSATFALDSTGVDIDSLRDGCFVVYWEVERYDGGTAPGEISYGNEFAGRSNVRFAGYLRRETITINPDNDTLTIEAISPLAKLVELAGFSQVLDTRSNPATWQQDERVTVNKLLWYVEHYHSTLSVCHDLVVPDTDYDFPDFAIQQATLKDQLIEVANGVSCTVLCDATGRIIIKRNLQRGTSTERNNAGVTLDMAAQDLREIPNLVYEHAYQYNSVLVKMFTTAGSPMLSIAPGEAPAEAPDRSTFERAIGVDQNEANTIAGFVFAELNSLYNGKPVPKGMTLKPHSGYGVLDPAYPMWIQVTLAATTNRRGRSLNGDKFLCAKVDISTDPETGLKDITWTLDHETYGYQGITRDIPVGETPAPYTPSPYVPAPTPLPSITPRLPTWNGVDQVPTQMVILDRGGAHWGYDPAISNSGGVLTLTWQQNSTGLGSGVGHTQCADPYDYRRYFALMSDGLYRNDNPKGGASWSLVANNAAIFGNASYVGHKIQMSINRRGYIGIFSGSNAYIYSFDYGATWNRVGIGGAAGYGTALNSAGSIGDGDFFISPRNSSSEGHIYACIYTGTGHSAIYKSTDWGANWSVAATGLSTGNAGRLNVPFVKDAAGTPNSNGSSQLVYCQSGIGHSGNAGYINTSTNGGTSWSTNTITGGSGLYVPDSCITGWSLQTFTYNGEVLQSLWRLTGAGGTGLGARLSDDGGATWYAAASTLLAGGAGSGGINGSPVHSGFMVIWSGANTTDRVKYTLDGGVTWNDITYPAFFSGDPADVQVDISSLIAPA